MKIKNKGKVSPEPDALSVLSLLPAAILAVASLLSLEDREVLAYLITRSLKTTTTTTATDPPTAAKKSAKRVVGHGGAAGSGAARAHKVPVFGCECFDCYTSYWFRWDSSPDRELINEAIEAFEDHLANGERSKKATRGKRRDKTGRRVGHTEKRVEIPAPDSPEPPCTAVSSPERAQDDRSPAAETAQRVGSEPGEAAVGEIKEVFGEIEEVVGEVEEAVGEMEEAVGEIEVEEEVVTAVAAASSHKGLARKVLPDVLGLFNSRLWSLWSPNVY